MQFKVPTFEVIWEKFQHLTMKDRYKLLLMPRNENFPKYALKSYEIIAKKKLKTNKQTITVLTRGKKKSSCPQTYLYYIDSFIRIWHNEQADDNLIVALRRKTNQKSHSRTPSS